jgi:uncharacterized protein (DUF58 family)
MFSDKIEKFIPPKKGKQHILRIIRELIEYESLSKGTDISEALRYLTNAIKKKCNAFVISDFMDFSENDNLNFEDALKIAGSKHDLVALRIYDKRENTLPPVGMIKFQDSESGQEMWVDTSDKNTREKYSKWMINFEEKINNMFIKHHIDSAIIATDQDYVVPLMKMFKKRLV